MTATTKGKGARGPRRWLMSVGLLIIASGFVWQLAHKLMHPVYRTTESDRKLIQWVRSRGGVVNAVIGIKNGLHGLIAKRDIPPAGLIIRLPSSALIKLDDLGYTGFAAEYTRGLLVRMHKDPTFNETYAPYLSTLPSIDEIFSPEVWDDRHELELQTPALEMLTNYSRRSTEQIFYGTYPEHNYSPLATLIPGGYQAVTLDTFKWMSAVVGSRFFGAQLDEDSDKVTYVLAPVMDMANHADGVGTEGFGDLNSPLNGYQTTFNGSLMLRALRPIKKGEEIRFNYQPGVNHRPDLSLLVYGFFQKRAGMPILCAVDLPTFSMRNQYAPTPESDEMYYGPKGQVNTVRELERLKALLAAAPTTVAQDEALLKSGKLGDWRDKILVEFRIERKRALIAATKLIEKELGKEKKKKKEKGGGASVKNELRR